MTEATIGLRAQLQRAIAPGFRERLLDTGRARGLIWQNGILPVGAPRFPPNLSDDLLDYGYAVLAMSLRLRTLEADAEVLTQAFLSAGEAIESTVYRGEQEVAYRGFHQVSAAVSFHLARYGARSYSILPSDTGGSNLAPTELALVHLIRRALDSMQTSVSAWLLDERNQDAAIAQRLRAGGDFDESDAIHSVLTTSFMRSLAYFDQALLTGEETSASEAQRLMRVTADAAKDLNAVNHWWTSTMASHLIDDLWRFSLHKQIPILPDGNEHSGLWNRLRRDYIQRLRSFRRAAIELWPSQIEASQRAVDLTDDLVVALPTSAGKTRIAELCILRAIASEKRVVYVTPLRALSAQVERDLAETFGPLGFMVSSLYGSAGIRAGDTETIRSTPIVVSTPEKLDFAIRYDPTLINDVGLIVLDEGHMLGADERGVRYEALIQRLLRRSDSQSRRIVCLSAMFPPMSKMEDFVGWIRHDKPGRSVHSEWRPTRQVFGIVQWVSDHARLEISIGAERPFVPRLIERREPQMGPGRSRRRNPFPSTKNELTLATAWQFVKQGKDVLVYCTTRTSVETLGRLIVKSAEQGFLDVLPGIQERSEEAIAVGSEWLGDDHPVVKCLKLGIVIHHGALPRPFLDAVERLLRLGSCRLTIASPTLAKGLNLSASVLLVPSIWRRGEIIPYGEFSNVAGRAGRAFVDIEGLVLHIVWENTTRRTNKRIDQWASLVADSNMNAVSSGLLQLAEALFRRIATVSSIRLEEVVEYVTNNDRAWEYVRLDSGESDNESKNWERDIASLDAAILAALAVDTEMESLGDELDQSLKGSLYSRQIVFTDENLKLALTSFLVARARHIWLQTTSAQRRGCLLAGVGLKTVRYLVDHIDELVGYLLRAEAAIAGDDADVTANAIIDFSRIALATVPFRPYEQLLDGWDRALQLWVKGHAIPFTTEMDAFQEVINYRIPWAMESVRSYAISVGQELADEIQGIAAMAVEVGSANRSAILLLRAGLNSRTAAMEVVAKAGATFADSREMSHWLLSEHVKELTGTQDWPTATTHRAWVQFAEGRRKASRQVWRRDTLNIKVTWIGDAPTPNTRVVVEPEAGLVLTPDLTRLGTLGSTFGRHRGDIVDARVGGDRNTVNIEFFAPIPE